MVVDRVPYLMNCGPGGMVCLKRGNAQGRRYWNQIQLGMTVSGIHKCHFVVWTPHILISFGIKYDSNWQTFGQCLDGFWAQCFMRVLWQKVSDSKTNAAKTKRPLESDNSNSDSPVAKRLML